MGGYTDAEIERICWLVAHHHTYTNIEQIDHRILIEADFLVNLYESNVKYKAILAANAHVFATKTGKTILQEMFQN